MPNGMTDHAISIGMVGVVPGVRSTFADLRYFTANTTIAVAIWTLGAAVVCVRWFLQWYSIRSRLVFAPEVSLGLPVPVRIASMKSSMTRR